ncbi:MAG: type II toxin-antitoxin system VapC family toxin [Chromatiaceae bacterium]|nr:MAG: type II toxin-antitoxin system VapC family toxin [Chromatiaceae bacterium]
MQIQADRSQRTLARRDTPRGEGCPDLGTTCAPSSGFALERFLSPLEIVPFDAEAARHYCRLRRKLKRAECPIGSNDLLIGAHALALAVKLVTNNVQEFSRIDGLCVEQWS